MNAVGLNENGIEVGSNVGDPIVGLGVKTSGTSHGLVKVHGVESSPNSEISNGKASSHVWPQTGATEHAVKSFR